MSTAPFKEISVFEPDLRAFGSHHVEYVRLLSGAATRAGLPLRAFGHRDVHPEVRHLTGAEPLFADFHGSQTQAASSPPWRRIPGIGAFRTASLRNRLAASELQRAFRRLDWDRQLVLVPNCHQGIAAAFAHCLCEPLRRHPNARAALVFPFVPSRHLFRWFFRGVESLIRAGRVLVATDSEPLAELYERLTGRRFAVLPMPYGTDVEEDDSPSHHDAPGGGTRFLVCGGFRMEKGIDLLEDLLARREADIDAGAMSFTLHGFANDTAPDPAAAHHFERIKAVAARSRPGAIRVIESALDTREYHRLFARCDAAILPYRHRAYAIRTSGVLTECLARGKPVITTSDTWLGQQVVAHGAGLVIPEGDTAALAEAARRMAADLPRFAAEAVARQPAWLAFHNPDNYVRMVTHFAAAASPAR